MNKKFDQLAKDLAQSVTRRQALRRFGVGLAGMALAAFALPSTAENTCIQSGHKCADPGSCQSCCSGAYRCGGPAGGKPRRECFCE